MLRKIKTIEKKLGRRERRRWGPREIDIDIIFCGDLYLRQPSLQIPHKNFKIRKFVLEPVNEILTEFQVPVLEKTIGQLLDECPDRSSITKLSLTTDNGY